MVNFVNGASTSGDHMLAMLALPISLGIDPYRAMIETPGRHTRLLPPAVFGGWPSCSYRPRRLGSLLSERCSPHGHALIIPRYGLVAQVIGSVYSRLSLARMLLPYCAPSSRSILEEFPYSTATGSCGAPALTSIRARLSEPSSLGLRSTDWTGFPQPSPRDPWGRAPASMRTPRGTPASR